MRSEDRIRVFHMIEAAELAAQFLSARNRDDLDRVRTPDRFNVAITD